MSATDKPFRVIATGLRGGRANIAFDQALIEARRQERIPDTIRFLRFRPSALIGIHQYLSHELKLDYCKAHGIETVRRITGGGGMMEALRQAAELARESSVNSSPVASMANHHSSNHA